MPTPPEDVPPIAEQLAALLAEPGAPSQRELAGRLALELVPRDHPRFKSKRDWKTRWIQKVLYPDQKGGVHRPSDASLDELERAVGRPGYFKRPARPARRAAAERKASVERRLEVLEERAVQPEDLHPLLEALAALATGKRSEALRVLQEAGVVPR